MSEPGCIHCLVAGRVQGVFFRASARDVAEALGLTGWVRNLPDGRVEVMAVGDAQALERFREWLREGPERALVTSLECRACRPQPFARFEVR